MFNTGTSWTLQYFNNYFEDIYCPVHGALLKNDVQTIYSSCSTQGQSTGGHGIADASNAYG